MDQRTADALIVSLASTNGMVVTTRQLSAAGIEAHLIRRRLGRLLTRVSDGTFVVGELTPEVRLRAALAAMPRSAVSERWAAGAHDLPLPGTSEPVVTVPGRTRRRIEGVRIRYTSWLPADDVTRVDGSRVTSVARTLCDLAFVLPRARIQHLIEHSITAQLTSASELEACIIGYRRRGRPGRRCSVGCSTSC